MYSNVGICIPGQVVLSLGDPFAAGFWGLD